jgi:tetratricopeptide (TPR) repeat protein
VEADPGNEALRAELGDLLAALKDVKGADQEYRSAIDEAGKPEQVALGYIKLGNLYMKEGKGEEAVRVLEEGYKKSGRSGAVLAALIQAYINQKRADQALKTCESWIAKNPKEAFGYDLLGGIRVAQNAYPEAETAFAKATDLRPAWPEPRNNLAKIYLVQGKREEAVKTLEEGLQQNPQNGEAYLILGQLYSEADRHKEAKAVYSRALKAYPNLWPAANNLAFLMCEYPDSPKDLEKALELATKAHELKPDDPAVIDTLGWVYYKLGDSERSLAFLKDLPEKVPNNPTYNYHLGMVLYKSGRQDEAKKSLTQAVESKESFLGREEAERTLAKLRAQG